MKEEIKELTLEKLHPEDIDRSVLESGKLPEGTLKARTVSFTSATDLPINFGFQLSSSQEEKSTMYGKRINSGISSPYKLKEPLRLDISEEIYMELKLSFSKLINPDCVTSLDFKNPNTYKDIQASYQAKFSFYALKDIYKRNRGLIGKYFDAMQVYASIQIDPKYIEKLPSEDQKEASELFSWAKQHHEVLSNLYEDIARLMETNFPEEPLFSEGFYFHQEPPIRLFLPGDEGTILHQDTFSTSDPTSPFLEGEDITVLKEARTDERTGKKIDFREIKQFPEMLNLWLPLHTIGLEEEHLALDVLKEIDEDRVFIPCLKDRETTAFMFPAGEVLHKSKDNITPDGSTPSCRLSIEIRLLPKRFYRIYQKEIEACSGPECRDDISMAIEGNQRKGTVSFFESRIYGNEQLRRNSTQKDNSFNSFHNESLSAFAGLPKPSSNMKKVSLGKRASDKNDDTEKSRRKHSKSI